MMLNFLPRARAGVMLMDGREKGCMVSRKNKTPRRRKSQLQRRNLFMDRVKMASHSVSKVRAMSRWMILALINCLHWVKERAEVARADIRL
jgi:hypothetical protein